MFVADFEHDGFFYQIEFDTTDLHPWHPWRYLEMEPGADDWTTNRKFSRIFDLTKFVSKHCPYNVADVLLAADLLRCRDIKQDDK